MKKTVSQTLYVILAVIMLVCLIPAAAAADEPQSSDPPDPTESVSPSEPVPTPTPSAAPTPAPTSTATPEPKKTVPTITKHPTGETVTVGGSAVFIAKADNAQSIVWRLVSADTNTTYECKDAPDYFRGLTVDGLGTERLTLSNIPLSLNGWAVEAKFVGTGGSAWSNGAIIHVTEEVWRPPVITRQPEGISLPLGTDGGLSVSATADAGETLTYQWYKTQTGSSANGISIPGATSASFVPPQEEGTVYYYVIITSTKNGRPEIYTPSEIVAVTYTSPAEPSETPVPTEQVGGLIQADPTPSPVPSADQSTSVSNPDADRSSKLKLLVILTVVSGLAIAAIVTLLIVNARRSGEDEYGADGGDEMSALPCCSNCGWQAADPSKVPRFCPNCGSRFRADK